MNHLTDIAQCNWADRFQCTMQCTLVLVLHCQQFEPNTAHSFCRCFCSCYCVHPVT